MNKEKPAWEEKIRRETVKYCINVIYLACFFGLFTWYRRLILAEYQISYVHYGFSLVEALILAKVVMLGDVVGLGRRLMDKPLIFRTLYGAVVFTLWVAVFVVFEHTVTGALRGKGLTAGLAEIVSVGKYELLARCLVTFFAFIPFFAFRELGRVLGEGKIGRLFFRKRAV